VESEPASEPIEGLVDVTFGTAIRTTTEIAVGAAFLVSGGLGVGAAGAADPPID
jgi:hypothetical protein